MQRAFQSRKLASIELKNSFIKTATFEGMYDDGIPNQKLIDYHVSMAKGGVALTTVSYGAISPDARTFKTQMYIHDDSLEQLKILADSVHQVGGKVSIQLTHCGYFSKNTDQKRPLAPSRVFNEYGCMSGIFFSRAMTALDLEKVSEDFAKAAFDLKNIGFDAVELHMGHGYLLSQFLSPWTNRRKDEYGGSLENRARYPLEVFKKIKQKVGSDFPILVKLNLSDGFQGGFTLDECKYVAKELEDAGCAALVLSGGFTSKTPFYLMRGGIPLKGMIQNGTSLAEKFTMALFAPFIIKKYDFEPNFFLKQARIIRETVTMPLVYLGGVDSKKGIEEILDAGFEFISIGRALIHDPDFLLKLKDGSITKSGCTRCNQCIVEMDRGGVRCVI
ncbi:MAG: NADH:flavin oxidoreductase [Saprospiraceae bacterium]|nr:NADH:flavin oxidoreductase [Saprospiraceae bacterium]